METFVAWQDNVSYVQMGLQSDPIDPTIIHAPLVRYVNSAFVFMSELTPMDCDGYRGTAYLGLPACWFSLCTFV